MRTQKTAVGLVLVGLGYITCAACGAQRNIDSDATGSEEDLTACSLSVTHNTYDGPNFWGTISVKNKGPGNASGFSVEFDVPSGSHCTNDEVPSGASLSPLNGSGSSAATKSNHCKFTWSSAKLASGASKTFNYSTDSSSFSSARNVVVKSSSCGSSGSTGSGGSSTGTGGRRAVRLLLRRQIQGLGAVPQHRRRFSGSKEIEPARSLPEVGLEDDCRHGVRRVRRPGLRRVLHGKQGERRRAHRHRELHGQAVGRPGRPDPMGGSRPNQGRRLQRQLKRATSFALGDARVTYGKVDLLQSQPALYKYAVS